MIELELFGRRVLVENVIFDMNGTLTVDGVMPERVKMLLEELARRVRVYIVTSDTFGVASTYRIPGVEIVVLDASRSASVQKKEWVERLGADRTAAVGNGYNDHLMLEKAALGIAVCWKEGLCRSALETADVVVASPEDALELLLKPIRIKATTRD